MLYGVWARARHTLEFNTFSKEYWNVYEGYNKPKSKISFKEAAVETEKLLERASECLKVADVPVSEFLSGGYDSTTAAALLQKDRRHTMSVILEGREPFLDHRVIELADQLPSGYKYSGCNKKNI